MAVQRNPGRPVGRGRRSSRQSFELVVAGFAPAPELLLETLSQALHTTELNHRGVYNSGALTQSAEEVVAGLTPQKRRITLKVEILPE